MLIKALKIAKEFEYFVEVAKFRQIWSHWLRYPHSMGVISKNKTLV